MLMWVRGHVSFLRRCDIRVNVCVNVLVLVCKCVTCIRCCGVCVCGCASVGLCVWLVCVGALCV